MKSSIISTKSKAFALRIVRLYKYLCKRKESVIAKQMLRSGTSIGANIAASRYAQSKTDFASKLQIALKEAAETEYWLELLRDSELVESSPAFDSLCGDCTELIKLLTASVKTAKEMRSSSSRSATSTILFSAIRNERVAVGKPLEALAPERVIRRTM